MSNQKGIYKYVMYSGFFMSVFYVFCAGFIYFAPSFSAYSPSARAVFAICLIAYGGFRFYRAYKQYKWQKEQEGQ